MPAPIDSDDAFVRVLAEGAPPLTGAQVAELAPLFGPHVVRVGEVEAVGPRTVERAA